MQSRSEQKVTHKPASDSHKGVKTTPASKPNLTKGVSSQPKKGGVTLNLGDNVDKHDSDFEKY